MSNREWYLILYKLLIIFCRKIWAFIKKNENAENDNIHIKKRINRTIHEIIKYIYHVQSPNIFLIFLYFGNGGEIFWSIELNIILLL